LAVDELLQHIMRQRLTSPSNGQASLGSQYQVQQCDSNAAAVAASREVKKQLWKNAAIA
jgi:hypothetical protein